MTEGRTTTLDVGDRVTALVLDESQRAALALALVEPIAIVTGGPGTGKTTILREALSQLGGQRVALAAPTGKAAKRIQETTGQDAKTLHRLLGYSPAVRGFYHGIDNPLPFDVVIVDESSMIDTDLFGSLLDAINPDSTRLVLVGDANQLPSVGPGAILADLVRSDLVPVARLARVHRSASESWICANAPRVLEGLDVDLTKRPDFEFVECEAAENLPKFCGDALDANADAQILVPQKTGKGGAEAINVATQAQFNPLRPGELSWNKAPHELRPRDRVIHTRNNYNLGVFNGECGTVAAIEPARMLVEFPDRNAPVEYTRSDANDLRLAYALTIHKSQGSEWSTAIVVVHSTHTFMLTRQLLYTAITRAKRRVVVVGDRKGFAAALKCKRDAARNTALCDRIRGTLVEKLEPSGERATDDE